jgi:hypothetical protein
MQRGGGDPNLVRVRPLLTLLAAVAVAQIALVVLILRAIPDWESRASFGDMFGATASLFSGLAFAGVIYAILLQRQELRLQREELALTRSELERSASAQERSSQALDRQLEIMMRQLRLSEDQDFGAVRPIFRAKGSKRDASAGRTTCQVVNLGATVSGLSISAPPGFTVSVDPRELFPKGEEGTFVVLYPPGSSDDIPFILRFIDGRGGARTLDLVFRQTYQRIEEPQLESPAA